MKQVLGILGLLVFVCAVTALASDKFLSAYNLQNTIRWTGLFGMIAVALCGWIFGFSIGIWFSWFGAALFSGFILYDTSRIIHKFDTTEVVAAVLELYLDIVNLFLDLLRIMSYSSHH